MLYTVPARTATRHITGRSRLNHLTDIGSLSTVIRDYEPNITPIRTICPKPLSQFLLNPVSHTPSR